MQSLMLEPGEATRVNAVLFQPQRLARLGVDLFPGALCRCSAPPREHEALPAVVGDEGRGEELAREERHLVGVLAAEETQRRAHSSMTSSTACQRGTNSAGTAW